MRWRITHTLIRRCFDAMYDSVRLMTAERAYFWCTSHGFADETTIAYPHIYSGGSRESLDRRGPRFPRAKRTPPGRFYLIQNRINQVYGDFVLQTGYEKTCQGQSLPQILLGRQGLTAFVQFRCLCPTPKQTIWQWHRSREMPRNVL